MFALSKRAQTRFLVLPPSGVLASNVFRNIELDGPQYDGLLAEMQRFRGSLYLRDCAIRVSDLTADGRHSAEVDEHSWHVLSLDRRQRVCACLRFVDESRASGFDELWVRRSALSDYPELGHKFRTAVEERMRDARSQGLGFGEVGGWAVGEEHRGTLEPLRIILATYALMEVLGGSLGVATATYRHESAPMLRRIGLGALCTGGEELPSYYDPHYGCQMQVLQFDSRQPNPKYRNWVSELAQDLTSAHVVCREQVKHPSPGVLPGFDLIPGNALSPQW